MAKRVLIVDDEPLIVKGLKFNLELDGYETDCAYTGEEASEKANIEAKGRDNLDAGISNIILGKQSIDTFDDVVKQAKKDGYASLLKIQQDAYNRYLEIIQATKK